MDETNFAIWSSVLLLIGIVAILRLVQVLPAVSARRDDHNGHKDDIVPKGVSLLILLGSGGHTGEMLRILAQFKHFDSFKRRYVISSGDSTSVENLDKFEKSQAKFEENEAKFDPDSLILLPRARNIGEGKVLATVNTLKSFAATVTTFLSMPMKEYPDVFLCNGPGTSIPIAYTLFLLKFLGLASTKIVYVESLARVSQLSLTGLLILPISDRIVVQWPQLKRYRRCEYYGMLV